MTQTQMNSLIFEETKEWDSILPSNHKDKNRGNHKYNAQRWRAVHAIENDHEYVLKLSKFLENYVLKLAMTGQLDLKEKAQDSFYALGYLLQRAQCYANKIKVPIDLYDFLKARKAFVSIRNEFAHNLSKNKFTSKERAILKESFLTLVCGLTATRQQQKRRHNELDSPKWPIPCILWIPQNICISLACSVLLNGTNWERASRAC